MERRGRTREQIVRDRVEIARLYLEGWPQWQIGEKFGFSPQQMSDELKAIRSEWRAAAVRSLDEAKARELAKLDNLEREYWEAWQQSREQAKKTKQNADPWFLEGIERCIGIRCELRGLLAPKRTPPHAARRR
ncbi:MAG TPA: helix-turn-helix domain-containing protein [Candidatus Binatia bacterium]|nr:helix-turn-helix domain-containing protein [Candidatus Binatia bacterium]